MLAHAYKWEHRREQHTHSFVLVSHCIFVLFCVQDLLQLQYEGVAVMKMFDKAKVNVNLLIFLLNKKFYGKWESKERETRWKQNVPSDSAEFVGQNKFCPKTKDGTGQSFVSSDYNLMDHTKMKCCYCPTKCICFVFFHVVIVNVMYF